MYRLARNFELPGDYATHCVGILGQRGSGKTTTALVVAEQMVAEQHPFVVIDPTGAWWGLRLLRNGKDPNPNQVLIVGGRHGDIPLPLSRGEELARYVCMESVSVIIDLSGHRQDEWEPFAADFMEGLYRHSEHARHLFIDEADLLAPQTAQRGRLALRNRVEDVVRRGRLKGLGVTMITQRAADLSKSVLGQVDALIVGRMSGKHDRKAVEDWVEAKGTVDQIRELMGELPELETGTMWVWSPQWLQCFKRVNVSKRKTFDSSATPEAGKRIPSRTLATLDVESLRLLLSDPEEAIDSPSAASGEEVRRLRDRVRVLERELDEAKASGDVLAQVESHLNEFETNIGSLRETLSSVRRSPETVHVSGSQKTEAPQTRRGRKPRARVDSVPERTPRPRPAARRATAEKSNGALATPEVRMLEALAWWESVGIKTPTRVQVALVARYQPSSGHVTNIFATLKKSGLIEYPNPGRLKLTKAGRKQAPKMDLSKTEAGLQSQIFAVLSGPQERIMRFLLRKRGSAVRRPELADATNFSGGSGHFTNILASLHKLKLVEYPRQGEVRASEVAFLD